MCKTVLLAGLVVLCAGLMQAEEAESGDIIVAKIRLVTPHYEYEWTADAEAAAVADAGVQPSAVFSWTALQPGREMTLAEFEREVLRTERRLVDTGLFYSVSVHVVPPRRKPLERTVVITVSDGFPYRYSGGNAFIMFGRKALGGNRASVYVYAGWNLFGVEAVHENLGNRGIFWKPRPCLMISFPPFAMLMERSHGMSSLYSQGSSFRRMYRLRWGRVW